MECHCISCESFGMEVCEYRRAMDSIAAKDAEIASLRALVKELADALEKAENKFGSFRGEYQREYLQLKRRALVAKARNAAGEEAK